MSYRVWTVPNIISFIRLALVPVFAWLIVIHADVAAIVVLVVSGITDWLDGALARRLQQYSDLGRILDPAADRAFIAVTAIGLAARGVLPWWLLAVLVAREIVVGIALLILRRRGEPLPQVLFVGKAATLALMYALPMLLLASLGGWYGRAAWIVGWAFAIWGIGLYWVAAAGYVRPILRPTADAAPNLAPGSAP
ncbi:MAG: CDP-alcohol phosphatidyltransferase family protein [Bifidobacteriaceae bacterium]|jgi:cardiolipin synthase|nr:CDP-alcohol phosphatidyltransferase family protein [Bifidobacteriaceae bacterium]